MATKQVSGVSFVTVKLDNREEAETLQLGGLDDSLLFIYYSFVCPSLYQIFLTCFTLVSWLIGFMSILKSAMFSCPD